MDEPGNPATEAVKSNNIPARLLISVTRRLFIALVILYGFSLIAAALLRESIYIVPLLVFASGVIGGFVGLQRRLKDLTLFDLELIAESWVYTALSPLVGGVLAFLLFILFLSGLLSGDLFPVFLTDSNSSSESFLSIFEQHGEGHKEYAKLIFWSFMAGFSEHFVTDVISRFEGAAVKSLPLAGQEESRRIPR
ncbi:MAG: hypothetical protein J0H48_12720 [Nitrosospira multiformis]|nr:hypothetical protein [Nitrosospira multiformis]